MRSEIGVGGAAEEKERNYISSPNYDGSSIYDCYRSSCASMTELAHEDGHLPPNCSFAAIDHLVNLQRFLMKASVNNCF